MRDFLLLLVRCKVLSTSQNAVKAKFGRLRSDHLSSFFGASAARQRLDPLDLFAGLFINGGVAEVDVPVQARVWVVLLFGGWVRVGCARLTRSHLINALAG
jgi:hypothetical protein